MTKKVLVGIALAILAAVVVWSGVLRTATLTIDVTGPAGARFTGTCRVDGRTQDLSGGVPAHFVVEGRSFEWAIVPAGATDRVAVAANLDGSIEGHVDQSDAAGPVEGAAALGFGTRDFRMGGTSRESVARRFPDFAGAIGLPR